MHELSITEALLALTLQHSGGARVAAVHVAVGELATVVDDSVQFYWDLVSAGSAADGARLCFRRIPAQLRCESCGHPYAPAAEVLACPACGSLRVKLTAGDEFYLEALEVEPNVPADRDQQEVTL